MKKTPSLLQRSFPPPIETFGGMLRKESGRLIPMVTLFVLLWLLVVPAAFATTGAVGDEYREVFELFNPSGTYRMDATLGNFTSTFRRDGSPVASGPASFRNLSTGAYTLVWTPSLPGWYEGAVYYNNTAVMNWRTLVRARDVDDLATMARAEQAFSNLSTASDRTDGLVNAIDDDPWDNPSRSLTEPVGVSFSSISGIDSRLSESHGTGVWDATGSVSVVPFQGTVSYETAAYGADVHVVRGDSVAIPYTIGQDITGWTVYFGAKSNPSDDTYAIGPKDVTVYVTDPSTGSGVITLDTGETSVQPRRYSAELEIRSGPSVNTVLRFRLWVDPDVIR